MGYLGTPIDTNNTFQSLQGKRFNGDGSETEFTLDIAPSSVLDIEVFIENVRQDPNSAYALSGTTMTFTSAPPSGTNNIYVVHQAKAVATIDIPYQNTNLGPVVTIGRASAEDTKIVFDGNAQDYHIGLDDSTDDLVIGKGSALGTTANIVIDENGHVTKPLQPGFLASSGTQNNMAVDAYVDIIYSTEIFDNNADYNTDNYTFTAPVTGRYHFSFSLNLTAVDTAGMNYVWFLLDTSNRDYRLDLMHSNLAEADLALHGFKGTVIADMDASDTAKMRFYQDGGTAQADVDGNSYFSGYLLG
tara:strand:+ start:58 stop:963 length:906 start_codon:yes stop_codon:yes gene_type:complete